MINFSDKIIISFIIICICIFISYMMHIYFMYKQNEIYKHFEQELKDMEEKFNSEIAKLKGEG